MIVFNPNKIRSLINAKRNTDKKFRQTDFLKEIQLSLPGLNNILDEKNYPGVDTLTRIANYFGKDMNHFFDIESDVSITNLKITDANEYMVTRFEQMAQELGAAKAKIAEYEKQEKASYTLQNVQNLSVAEKQAELTKKQT